MTIKINSLVYDVTNKEDIDIILKILDNAICISEQICGDCEHYNKNGLCGADLYNDYCADRDSHNLCDCGKFKRKLKKG